MRVLDAYILRQLVAVTLIVTGALTCAIWLTQSLRFIELIVNRGLGLWTFLHLTLLLLPSFLWLLLPIAGFVAVLFTYLKLISDSEAIVIGAFGAGPLRLATPALLLGGGLSAVAYALSLYFLPLAYREFKDLEFAIRNDFGAILLREGAFNMVAPNVTVYVRSREASGDLIGILLHDGRRPDAPITMIAERGRLALTESGPRVVLVNGNRQELDRRAQRLQFLSFDRYSVDLGRIAERGADRWREPRERFLSELFGPPRDDTDRTNLARLRAEGHNRLAASLLPIALALAALAVLLPGDIDRRGRGGRVVMAVAAAALIQTLALSLQNIAARWPMAVPLIYAHIAVVIIGSLWWLTQPTPAWLRRWSARWSGLRSVFKAAGATS
jgi:lipopolysaccharide export system permease protein